MMADAPPEVSPMPSRRALLRGRAGVVAVVTV